MKNVKFYLLIILVGFYACSTIRVSTDYDESTDFNSYKTFAFYKSGIDKAKISDIDKKRILRAIELDLIKKGYEKSSSPDFLVSIFAKSRKKVNVDTRYNNYMYYPSYFNNRDRVRVTQYTEGSLFIDLLDKKSTKLIWQGIGSDALRAKNGNKKNEKIQMFVAQILKDFPLKTK